MSLRPRTFRPFGGRKVHLIHETNTASYEGAQYRTMCNQGFTRGEVLVEGTANCTRCMDNDVLGYKFYTTGWRTLRLFHHISYYDYASAGYTYRNDIKKALAGDFIAMAKATVDTQNACLAAERGQVISVYLPTKRGEALSLLAANDESAKGLDENGLVHLRGAAANVARSYDCRQQLVDDRGISFKLMTGYGLIETNERMKDLPVTCLTCLTTKDRFF